MKKKVFSVLLCVLTLMLITAIPVAAAEVETTDATIQPFYVASCPGGGKHSMYIKSGLVSLWTGSSRSNPGTRLYYHGHGYNCSKCNLAIFCNQEVAQARMLGYYSIQGTMRLYGDGYDVYCNGNYGYNSGGLTTDSYWSGFDWYGAVY